VSTLGSLSRSLRRDPGITLLVALTVAVGVGLATALFAYLDTFFHPHVAAPHAERIVSVRIRYPDWVNWSLSSEETEAVRASGAFELVTAGCPFNATVATPAGNVFAWGHLVDGRFFELFAGSPALGRLLAPPDDDAGAPPVVVLSHRLWRTAFASDPAVLGRSIDLNGHPATVVGVTERAFEGVGFSSELFVPSRLGDPLTGTARSTSPFQRWLYVRARLRDETAALDQASAVLGAAFAALNEASPLPEGESREPLLVAESRFDPQRRDDPFFLASRLLTAAGVLFVLLGAANLAALLLARATARDREWATRKALGASPRRLAGAILGRLLAPTLLGLAGAVGVARLVASWIDTTLTTPMAGLGPGWASETSVVVAVGWRAWCFALAATGATLLVAAAPPLLRVLRRDVGRTLRAESARGGSDRAVLAPRKLLVAGQISLAVTLLVGAGLLARSLRAAASGELGFDPRGLTFATLNLPRGGAASGGASADVETVRRVLERARSSSGIEAATVTLVTPLAPYGRPIAVAPAEAPDAPFESRFTIVGPGYFETLGVPLVDGRPLDQRDTPDSPPSVVVTAALAERIWGNAPAVGRRLHFTQPIAPDEAGPDFEVVGVVADTAFVEPTVPRPEMIFFAYGQRRHSRMTLVVRSSAPLGRIEPRLRDVVAAARADASLVDLVPAEEQLRRTLHPLRLNATVAGGLALGGLTTALLGLFALQSYTVRLRRRELAVRAALGADGRRLAKLVLEEAGRLAAAGALIGLAAAGATVRLLESLLFGVSAADPWTFGAVPLVLGATVLLASWFPARRAARVDPAENLRAL
jgi:putative ABC transport system permease protein